MGEKDLYLNTDMALSGAARLAATGEDWRRTWSELAAAVAAAEAASPFGDDEIGAQMKASYERTAAALRPAGQSFGACYESIADQCRTAVAGFRANDHLRPSK